MVISRRSRMWNGFFLAALLLSLLGALAAPSRALATTDPPDPDRGDDRHTPLAVEVTMAELPAVGRSTEVTIVVSSTQPADGVRVEVVTSDGVQVDGQREFVIDVRAGEAHTLQTRVSSKATGNHSVAANVSRDFGGGAVWGDSDGVYFYSDEGSATEGFRYIGDPTAGAGVPGPGNNVEFTSEAFPDGSMPAPPLDGEVMLPVDTGEPGGRDGGDGDIAAAAGNLQIRGHVGMIHRNGQWKNQILLVSLVTSSGAVWHWTYSDYNGNFVFNVSNPGVFRIRVWANYSHSSMNIGAIRVVGNGLQTQNRFSIAGWHYNLPAMGPFSDGEVNVGSWMPDPAWSGSRAWWIYQDMVDAWLYARNQTPPGVPAGSRQPDGVTVEWEPGSTVGTFYSTGDRRVRLEDVDANSGSTVLHEYGHAVMHNVYSVVPISDCPNPHFIENVSGPRCAWTEGWANFFSIAVRYDPIYSWGCALPCTPASLSFEDRYAYYFPAAWDTGPLVEGNVAASLWDFMDPYIDGYDKTNGTIGPFWQIWDIVYNHVHLTFSEFWNYWEANVDHANSLATLYQNTIDYGWSTYCPDYLAENDDNALLVPLNANPSDAPYQRAFCTGNDFDWYKFQVAAGSTYIIETSNLGVAQNGSVADTTLTLYRMDPHAFTQMAYDDNGGSQNLASRITYAAPANGELFIAVRHKDGVGNPGYTYTIDFTLAGSNVAPTVTVPTHRLYAGPALGNPEAGVYTVDVMTDWTASDPDDGIAFQSLYRQIDQQGFAAVALALAPTVQSHNVPMTIGTANQLQVSATDNFGATSDVATGESFAVVGAQETDFSYAGMWTEHEATHAWGGSYVSAGGDALPSESALPGSGEGAVASVSFTGSSVALVGLAAPDGGYAEIYIDGELAGLADFYGPKPLGSRVLFAVNDLSAGAHELEVHWIPYANEWSSGYQLYLDGIIALD